LQNNISDFVKPKLNARTIRWFLKRPRLYLELWRFVISTLLNQKPPASTAGVAEDWCAERAISTTDAILRITRSPMPEPVSRRFSAVFAEAKRIAEACPVGMGGAPDLDLVYWLTEHVQATRVVETGVAYGWSTLIILLSIAQRNGARLVSSDRPYPNRNNEPYVGCIIPNHLKSHWKILPYADREAVPRVLRTFPSIDLCHYDSDKSYAGKRWSYARLWTALRPGGVFISDDVSDDLAFHDFCAEVRAEPVVIRTALDYCVEMGIHPTSVRKVYPGEIKYAGVLIKP